MDKLERGERLGGGQAEPAPAREDAVALADERGEAIAICHWSWRRSEAYPWSEEYDPIECRASIGAFVVTVWLPRGTVIRLRRRNRYTRSGITSAYDQTFTYLYGWRADQNQIKINLKRKVAA